MYFVKAAKLNKLLKLILTLVFTLNIFLVGGPLNNQAEAYVLVGAPTTSLYINGNLNGNGQFNFPHGMAIGNNGYVYVADTHNRRIQVFDTNWNFVCKWGDFGDGDTQFKFPVGLSIDRFGYIYVVDNANHRVQKFTQCGNFVTKWGSLGSGNGQFSSPNDSVVTSNDYIYISDAGNNRIQQFDLNGNYIAQFGSVGTGNGQFSGLQRIAVDSSNNIYTTETGNDRVQKFNSSGIFQMKFGTLGAGDGQFNNPFGIAIDTSGNIYVGEYNAVNDRIQKFNSSGIFQSKYGSTGSGNTQFTLISHLDVYGGNLYIDDADNHRIMKHDLSGNYISKIESLHNGNGKMSRPYDAAVDSNGNIYVVDKDNYRIQKFNSSGVYQLQWGTKGTGDGQFTFPKSIAIDSSDNIYVSDVVTSFSRIQKFDTNGNYISKFGSYGTGVGQIRSPYGLAVDSGGNIYVADYSNARVLKFNSSGTFQMQFGSIGTGNGQFNYLYGLSVDSVGNIYTVEYLSNRVQKFNSSGVYQSQFGSSGTGNGQFSGPSDITIGYNGDIFVTEAANNRVQQFNSAGIYIRQWGSYGTGTENFSTSIGISVDSTGREIYVSDLFNNAVHKYNIDSDGQISNLSASLDTETLTGNNIEAGSSYGLKSGAVRLKKGGVIISDIVTDIGINDKNWSGVSADVDTVNGMSVVSGLVTAPGAASTHSLYIPYVVGSTGARVCPAATTLGQVDTSCASGVNLSEGQVKMVNGVPVTLTKTTISGQTYWVANGVNGTGGISIFGSFPIRDTMSRLQISTASNHAIDFGTTNGLLASGDTITVQFDPGVFSFNLTGITVSDIDLEDDGSDLTLASSAGVSTWGVNINTSTDTITFTAPTSGSGYIAAGSTITVKVGTNATFGATGTNQITNPASVNSYELYLTNVNGVGTETAQAEVAIIDDDTLNVYGFIDTSLTFDIDTTTDLVASTNTQCDAAGGFDPCNSHGGVTDNAGYVVDLGEMITSAVNNSGDTVYHQDGNVGLINTIDLDISSNAQGGIVITVVSLNESLLSGGSSIPSVVGGPVSITGGSGLYGIREMDNTSVAGTFTIAIAYNGSVGNYGTVADGGTPLLFASTTGPINQGRIVIEVGASPDAGDTTGTYTDQLTFIATATF